MNENEESVRGCSCGMADYGAPGHEGHPDFFDQDDHLKVCVNTFKPKKEKDGKA